MAKKDEKFLTKLQAEIDRLWESDDYKARRKNMDRWLKEYNGEWWTKENLKPYDSKIFCNYVFATVETNAPLLTDNRPIWHVRARDPMKQDYLNVYSKALDYLWDKLEMDTRTYEVVKDSQIWPVGLLKVYFDPDSEFGGEVQVRLEDPRTFFISSGDEDLWDCRYCGTVKRRTLSWIKSNYPDAYPEVKPDDDDKKVSDSDSEGVEFRGRKATVYELWMEDDATEEYLEEELDDGGNPTGKKSKKQRDKYPNGRYIVFTKNLVVLDDKPSPFSHGKPPWVAFYDYQAPHSFWGICEPIQIEELNREFNARLQDMVHHCNVHARTNYIVDSASGIDVQNVKENIHKGDNVWAANATTVEQPIRAIEQPSFSKVHQDVMQGIGNLIEEVSGVTDISKGMASKKQRQSASEVSILIESSYTRTRQRVRNLESSIKRVAYMMLELMQQFYTEPRTFSYRQDNEVNFATISNSPAFAQEATKPEPEPGENPQQYQKRIAEDQEYQEFVRSLGEDKVYADFDIEIQTNSTLPMDKQSLANLALRLGEVQVTPNSVIDAEAILDILRFPNKEKIINRKIQFMQMQAQMAGGGGPGAGAPPNPTQGPPQPGVPTGLKIPGGQPNE